MMTAALLLAALLGDPVQGDGVWEKLADAPKDLAGREIPPGLDGAWTYVPEWKGFLLYGGASPTYSNEGWFFDPDRKAWTLLWAHDALAHDGKEWKVLLPRDIVWSLDRPSPARLSGAAHDGKTVYLAGGHPNIGHKNDGRHDRSLFFGPGKLGTWTFSGGRFKHQFDDGPGGATWMVCDKAHQALVTAPDGAGGLWVLPLSGGSWQRRPVQGPKPRNHAGWTYDASAKRCVYFAHGETWTYDVGANAWKNAQPSGSPPNRHHAAFCFDEASGRTILHGGVLEKHNHAGAAFESVLEAKSFGDTWAYDAAKNEWKEIRPPGAPAATFSSRNLFAYDPERKMCVLYDVAIGVYAYRSGATAKAEESRRTPLPTVNPKPVPKMPQADPQVVAWQQKIRSIPDNTWFDPDVQVPVQGCMNITYDPKNHCIPQIGGCGGALYATGDDYGYHNQVWLFDMDAGRFYLRRAHHAWGPETKEFGSLRLAAGCTRTAGFDSSRGILWAIGGNGTPLLKIPRSIRSYDVATDRCTPAGPGSPKGDGESEQIIYDSKNDLVVMTDTRRQKKTFLYQPKTNTWLDGGPIPPVDHPDLFGYCHIVYDPEVGVIMIGLTGGKMKTWAYNAAAKSWRDLAPKGNEMLPPCDIPGVACDSRNRAVLFVKNDHGDMKSRGPQPYGSLYILDLATNTWNEGPPSPYQAKLANGSMVYDPNHNLTICSVGFRGKYMFYRYKGGCPAEAFKTVATQ